MDAGTSINLNLKTDVLEKLKNALNDSSYRETIESSSNYNNRLVVERKTRIPFIDSQTGVAQNDCYLWMQKWERMPGTTEGQLYSYPKKRWRKKKRSQYLLNNNYGLNLWEKNQSDKNNLENNLLNGHEQTTENNLKDVSVHEPVSVDKFFDNVVAKDDWMTELDDVNDFNDTVDNDDNESDYDDDYSNKKKKKKKDNLGSGKKKKSSQQPQQQTVELNSNDKPYKCDLCGMKYKTRPGLSYHYSHTHSVDVDGRKQISGLEEEDSQQSNSSLGTIGVNGLNSRSSQISNSTSNSPLPNSFNSNNNSTIPAKSQLINHNLPSASPIINKNDKNNKKPTTPSSYCDFCLGNSEINKKTRTSEEMISCHHCGRSAHPTCLQFTPNMLKSVKKYAWECLECKSCGICGTSDNDDQLLFCDDCDRGYHSHCVGLKDIPEGEWSCSLCMVEYHKDKLTNDLTLNNNSNNTVPTNLNNTNLANLLSKNNSSSSSSSSSNTANLTTNSNNKTTNSHTNSATTPTKPLTTSTTEPIADKS